MISGRENAISAIRKASSWTGAQFFTQLEAGSWQYFVTVRKGAKMTHYVDGKETASGDVAKDPVKESVWNLRIGDWGQNGNRQFNGLIDEVGIFNEALSVDDIKNIATKGLTGATAVSPSGKLATAWAAIKVQY